MVSTLTVREIQKAKRRERQQRQGIQVRAKGQATLNRLWELRRSCGLSQVELADAIGVNQGLISNLESGRHGCQVGTALLLARFFECSVHDIFSLPEEVDA